MQSKEDLEKWHATEDAWGYTTNSDDQIRKDKILSYLGKYDRAIDIGAAEGWVTEGIDATTLHAIETSDNAAQRFSEHIQRVHEPDGQYDLVMTTGTLYPQYNAQQILEWIKSAATKHVLAAGIKDWLPVLPEPTKYEEFKYRGYTQAIYFYEAPPQHWN